MFKVLIIVCTILPYPRGEILNTQCYYVEDKWQPYISGYTSKTKCLSRVKEITKKIRSNYNLLDIKKYNCAKNRNLTSS